MSVGWNCRCGKVRLVVATGEGARCVCYCRDCRAFHTHLGAGAWLDGQRLSVSRTADAAGASISTGNLGSLAASDRWPMLGELLAGAGRTRGYGDFYHYHRLAAGQIDAVIESDVNILDIAALSLIVTEAGGVFTDLEGGAVGLETRSVLAANPALHGLLLARFAAGADQ